MIGRLVVTEPANITRNLEYIELKISVNQPLLQGKTVFLKDENGKLVQGQILQGKKDTTGTYSISCIFPISIQASEVAHYDVLIAEDRRDNLTDLKVMGKGLGLIIENSRYVANLTSEKATPENGLGAGQLTALILKNFDGQKLQRSGINMHWAPNFKKKELNYKTIGHIRQFDSVSVNKGSYMIAAYRSGKVEGYEEILVTGQYQFYAGLPYFIFSSEMKMVDNVTLTMLRNDEMTMDSLFTHAMFPLPNGHIKTVPLYNEPPLTPHYSIKELRKTPIDANTGWFCFYNDSLKYGFGSIRLQYDYTNAKGGQSPMLNPETRITYAGAGGRYWDRRFVFSKTDSLVVPRGSKYAEKNAYVIFPVDPEDPSKEIEELFISLTHPVTIEYSEL